MSPSNIASLVPISLPASLSSNTEDQHFDRVSKSTGLDLACLASLLLAPAGSPLSPVVCADLLPSSTFSCHFLPALQNPGHLLYHLLGLCLLRPPLLCLANSYSCFRCQFKCYAFRGAFEPAPSLFALLECVAFPRGIYASV